MNNNHKNYSVIRLSTLLLGLILILSILDGCRSAKNHKKASTTKSKSEKRSYNKRESREVEKLIKTARSYTGTCYRYGGSTRTGMDCSGLVVESFKSLNILLPRTSIEQSKMGKEINTDEIQAGDLVFFSEKKGNKKVSHVGLVTDVNRDQIKFIHSTTQLGVIENDLFSDYYKSIFIKAVRILP